MFKTDKSHNTMSKVSSLNAFFLATIPIIGIYLLPGGLPLNWVLTGLLLILNFFSGNFANAFTKRSGEFKWFLVILFVGFLGFALNSGNYFSTSLYFNNHATILIFFFSLIVFTYPQDIILINKNTQYIDNRMLIFYLSTYLNIYC